MMHLKDLRKGAPPALYTGQANKADDVTLGSGQVNWPAVLAAANKVGVKHYFIEDESPIVDRAAPREPQVPREPEGEIAGLERNSKAATRHACRGFLFNKTPATEAAC